MAGLFISLDGVTEAPGEWTGPYFDDSMAAEVRAQMEAADAVLLGRRTYQEWAAYWPGKTAADDPFAGYINAIPKYVASTTLTALAWQPATLIGRDLVEALSRLAARPGGNIAIHGSATLVRSLLRDGLLDELRLIMAPVVVGGGTRLFEAPLPRIPLRLVSSRQLASGAIVLVYQPETER